MYNYYSVFLNRFFIFFYIEYIFKIDANTSQPANGNNSNDSIDLNLKIIRKIVNTNADTISINPYTLLISYTIYQIAKTTDSNEKPILKITPESLRKYHEIPTKKSNIGQTIAKT